MRLNRPGLLLGQAVSGIFAGASLGFDFRNGSLLPVRGSATLALTRATVATLEAFDEAGYVIRSVLSGEARFEGLRRERNVVATTSEDWSNAAWTKTIGTVTATTLTSTGANQTCLQTFTAASSNWVLRVEMSRLVGTGNIQLTLDGGGTWTTVTLTSAVQVFSIAQTAVTNPQFGIRIAASGDSIYASKIGVYETIGRTNTNPPEYIPVGVISAPFPAGVENVRYFNTYNGNTVSSNVVTEATGAAITASSIRGLWPIEPASSLAKAAIATGPFAAGYTDVGTPTRVADNVRCGDFTLDLIGDDSAAALEGKTIVVAFTGDAAKVGSVLWKVGTSTSTVIRLRDTTAGANRLLLAITNTAGVPTVTYTTGSENRATEALAGGVYRIHFNTAAVTAANTNQAEYYPATDAALAVGGTGTVNLGGIQWENSTVSTSLATAARNADSYVIGTLGSWFNAAEGTIVCEAGKYIMDGTNFAIASFDDTTGNERIQAIVSATAGANGRLFISDGGVTQADLNNALTFVAGTLYKMAGAYKANDCALSSSGSAVATDATATLPTVTRLVFGAGGAVANSYGGLRTFAYIPRRIENTRLVQRTL